jgi:hypothetical protein
MSNEEMVGRMAALEVIAMTALGLHLANTRNDPDHRRSGVLLATMRDALRTQAATLPTEAQKHTMCYGNHLLDAVRANLSRLRGEDSQLN